MIIPSIDIMAGQAVQLVGGRDLELTAGDPRPLATRFGVVGEVAVIDLDAALGRGSNAGLIRELLKMCRCRVGGGIRSVGAAIEWLDAGAESIILGTAARPELLKALPKARVIAALDAAHGEVLVEGWRTGTGQTIEARMAELRPYVGGFLITFIEREGRLGGTNLDAARKLVAAAGDARVTIAGGICSTEEIAELDRLGADAQIGMALYKGELSLTDCFAAPLTSDRPDGLWPTVVVDELGIALGLCYSSRASLARAIETRRGVYHSRHRGLWTKGEESGAIQELLAVDADCDRDTLRFTVRQHGAGFCHRNTRTCWGEDQGIAATARRIASRVGDAPAGSYTRRLLDDPALLRAKLIEEAAELAEAREPEHVANEAADLLYFTLTALARAEAALADVDRILRLRGLRVTRRAGDVK